jgi:hypothetical protein
LACKVATPKLAEAVPVESEQPRAEINNHDANGDLFQCQRKARVFPLS